MDLFRAATRRQPTRRSVLAAAALTAAAGAPGASAQPGTRIAALFAGRIDDGGFMEAGYRGLVAARDRLGCGIAWVDRVRPERDALERALGDLAAAGPALVIAHGGQNNEAARAVASARPATRFAVTQGAVVGPNLASYEVLQEQSAFLAGALAASVTRTGVVGHMSGIRVIPGLKGRAAFANGVAHVDPRVRLLTNFSGNQDDAALAARIATAMAEAGADVLFTMLNAGRAGAIAACRARGIAQIGNVVDWVARQPDVFIGSAVADAGLAVFAAAQDVVSGKFQPGRVSRIGLENPDAVRLVIAPRVAADVSARIDRLADAIKAGVLVVPTQWTGPEFSAPS